MDQKGPLPPSYEQQQPQQGYGGAPQPQYYQQGQPQPQYYQQGQTQQGQVMYPDGRAPSPVQIITVGGGQAGYPCANGTIHSEADKSSKCSRLIDRS